MIACFFSGNVRKEGGVSDAILAKCSRAWGFFDKLGERGTLVDGADIEVSD